MDTLIKIPRLRNKVIIGRERSRKYLTKDVLFDIQSLADQLYHSQSIISKSPEPGKIYFSENLVSDLLKKGIKQLHISV